jgi:hypothetical protein
MKLIFTEYVRSLKPGTEPDPRMFEKVWSTLRGALFTEMRRRSLWKLPPSFFGIYGRSAWSEEGAFDELASDCYTFVFLERLPALQAQLEVKDNVEGLVFRNVRNFLHDAQKSNDPVGFLSYKVVRAAVTRLLATGALHVTAGGPGLGPGTVLAFSPGSRARPAPDAAFDAAVREWCDELTPGIVTARGRQRDEVAETLAERLAGLPEAGVEAFRWKDLVDLVKSAVRARWHALGTGGETDTAFERVDEGETTRIRVVRPDTGVEDRDSFAKLCTHVERRLERYTQPAGGRRELVRLWDDLMRHASGTGRRKTPSRRQMARRLAISRHKLAGHFATLGRWVDRFQAAC